MIQRKKKKYLLCLYLESIIGEDENCSLIVGRKPEALNLTKIYSITN